MVGGLLLIFALQADGTENEGGASGPYACDGDGFGCFVYNRQAFDNGSASSSSSSLSSSPSSSLSSSFSSSSSASISPSLCPLPWGFGEKKRGVDNCCAFAEVSNGTYDVYTNFGSPPNPLCRFEVKVAGSGVRVQCSWLGN
eukprot:2772566-Rhodomonas_salina.1